MNMEHLFVSERWIDRSPKEEGSVNRTYILSRFKTPVSGITELMTHRFTGRLLIAGKEINR